MISFFGFIFYVFLKFTHEIQWRKISVHTGKWLDMDSTILSKRFLNEKKIKKFSLEARHEFADFFPHALLLRISLKKTSDHENLNNSYADHREDDKNRKEIHAWIVHLRQVAISGFKASQHVLKLSCFAHAVFYILNDVLNVLNFHFVEFLGWET